MSIHQGERQQAFQRNERLEVLLSELNGVLGDAEKRIGKLPERPAYPVVLVVGAPRSGTTLLVQWLAASGLFAVPTNLLSRFFGAPYIGARIQQLLTDPAYNHQNELGDPAAMEVDYASHVGKTKGMLQPNEFWYFWRRFIPNTDPEWITPEQEQLIDRSGFLAGIAAIEAAFSKPFASKGIILQYNLTCLQRILGKVLFVHTRRHPFFNIQSLLKARRDYFGDEHRWFSVKPREYDRLKDLDPVEQVAGQVYFTRQSIDNELAAMDERYGLIVDHESFCASPGEYYDRLRQKLSVLGYDMKGSYRGPKRFDAHETVMVDTARQEAIRTAYERFSAEPLGALPRAAPGVQTQE